jgi:hypothetical protein
VDLQAVLDRCYDAGLYVRRARYGEPPPKPTLSLKRAAWVESILRAKALLPQPT